MFTKVVINARQCHDIMQNASCHDSCSQERAEALCQNLVAFGTVPWIQNCLSAAYYQFALSLSGALWVFWPHYYPGTAGAPFALRLS